MVERENSRAREAALLIHGLPANARQRVIAKLDPAAVSRLTPLLDELVSLGVPASMGRHLQSLVTTERSLVELREQVARLDAEEVIARLEACAPATVACILRAGDWPWRPRVLEWMAEGRRARVLEHMRSPLPLAPAVVRELLRRLCIPGKAPRSKRWFGWIR